MGRETYLADLYRQSVQALTQNRTEWMGRLSSVSKYYKMSFDKNVLIYVQRPDAGLLATKMGEADRKIFESRFQRHRRCGYE